MLSERGGKARSMYSDEWISPPYAIMKICQTMEAKLDVGLQVILGVLYLR